MPKSCPGQSGLIGLTLLTLAAAIGWLLSGAWRPALACGAGLATGWRAVKAINK